MSRNIALHCQLFGFDQTLVFIVVEMVASQGHRSRGNKCRYFFVIYIPLNSQELCSSLFKSCDRGGNACKLATSTVKLAHLSGAKGYSGYGSRTTLRSVQNLNF